MQKIQLYIEGQRVDMFADESVSITQTIQNVKDISKVFTDFSKTFSLPASKVNNKIFKHYQNFDIDNGFDARKKVDAKIELNNKKFRDGKIKLEGVDMKAGLPHTYRVTFFGNTVNLKDTLGEDTLASLSWLNNFSHSYTAAQVRQAMTEGINKTADSVIYNDALVAPLITNTTRLFYDSVGNYPAYPDPQGGNLNPDGTKMQGVYYEEVKYAIRLHIIIKAIEETYGIVFSNDFFREENLPYYNLYMWLHRKKGFAFDSTAVTYQVIDFPLSLSEMIGVACYPDSLKIFNQPKGVTYNLVITSATTQPYTVVIKKDGQVFDTKAVTSGNTSLQGILTNSSSGYSVFIQTDTAMTNVVADWQLTSIQYPESFNYTSSQFNVSLTQEFIITEQIPEMKVIDFLTGLFKMWNLTAFEKDGVVTVKTLDNFYYESSKEWDITKYVDIESSSVDIALPYNRIDLKYEGLDTKLANQHNQITVKGWGSTEFDAGDNYDGGEGIYEVTAPFEHIKYERLINSSTGSLESVQVGWYVDDNNDPYYGKPLLMYCVQSTGTLIRFLNDKTSSYNDLAAYFVPSNTLALTSAEAPDSIHFNLEVSEYTFTADFTDTLFNKYYKSYISDIFDTKRRVSRVKAYLPLNFLINYTLADDIKIGDKRYIINSIETNLANGESNLELLNIVSDQLPTSGTGLDKLPVVNSLSASSRTQTSIKLNGQVTDFGQPQYTQRGFYWMEGIGDPTAANEIIVVPNADLNPFSFTKTGLTPEADYSYAAFATNTVGTDIGSTINTSTLAVPVDYLATASTLSATNVTYNSARLNGNISNVGQPAYTSKGFYWKQTDGIPPNAGDNIAYSFTTGTGSYFANISVPNDLTNYSFVAFVTNSVGTYVDSNVLNFTSLEEPAQLTTATVVTNTTTNKTAFGARFNGQVTNAGNPPYTERGFVYNLGSNIPTTANNKTTVGGTDLNPYFADVSLIQDNALYTVRAYAINSQGTAYGLEDTFYTEASQVCDGGTLFFNTSVITGVDATLQQGQTTYGTGSCGAIIPTLNLLLTNNEGVWLDQNQITGIQLFEGATDVTNQYTLSHSLIGDNMYISIDGSFPDITNDGDHYYELRVTGYNIPQFTTTINLPAVNVIQNATVNVIATTIGEFPASRDDANYTNTTLYPFGVENAQFQYTVIYTANSGYEFSSIDDITLGSTTGLGVNMSKVNFTDSTFAIRVFGDIQNSDILGSVDWSGSAVAAPDKPVVVTYDETNLTYNTVRLNAEILYSGNPPYSDKGFYFCSGDRNPTALDTILSAGTGGDGAFFYDLNTGLNELSTYSFRAYATNTEGTNTGLDYISFTTPSEPKLAEVVTSQETNKTYNSATLNGSVTYLGNLPYT